MKLCKEQALALASLARENSSRIKLAGRGLSPEQYADLCDQLDREALLASTGAERSVVLQFGQSVGKSVVPKGVPGTLDRTLNATRQA